MNSSFFKSIFRGLRKQKMITFINLMGLSIGLTLVMFIVFYLFNESQADKFHQNAKNIYRVEVENSHLEVVPGAPLPLSGYLKDNFPDVELVTRVSTIFEAEKYVTANNRNFEIKNPLFVDPSFFRMFSFPVSCGNVAEDFKNKYAVVLTAPLAKKLFGEENPLGKTMTVCGKNHYTVTAVLKELPANSSMQFDLLMPFSGMSDYYENFDENEWGNNSFDAFILCKSDTRILTEKVNAAIGKEKFPNASTYSFLPLTEVHFSPEPPQEYYFRHGSKTELYIFMLVAFVILLIAIVNFINLTVALSSLRFKENGIRKIEGASQFHLLAKLIAESILISMSAAVVAALLIESLFPLFISLLSNPMERVQLRQPWFYVGLAGLGLLTGLMAGIYPALKFSRVSVVSALRGKQVPKTGSGAWNDSLLVFQFATSIVLIISTLFLNRQMDFIQTRQLGFDKDQVLYISLTEELKNKKDIIKERLREMTGIEQASTCDGIIGMIQTYSELGYTYHINGEDKDIGFYATIGDHGYVKTLGLQIVQGRDFDPDRSVDHNCRIVNESFVRKYGLNDKGESFIGGSKIIGVVKDFNFGSLHGNVEPWAIQCNDNYSSVLMIRINASTLKGVLELVGTIKKSILYIVPNAFFEVQFVDTQIQNQYIKEKKASQLLSYFSFFAIFISCLGLFALATLTINKRIKEIGIRKVNGARISEVLVMLNKDFVKWVIIAFVIATPIAYYAMNKWLETFAYKTELSWWIFVLAGLLALGIALLTVSWQSWKAATRNPVEALRYE